MKHVDKYERIWDLDDSEHEDYTPFFDGDEFNDPVVLELGKPIMLMEVETTEITIHPPTAAQMMEARSGKGKVETRTAKYFAQCCNVPLTVFTDNQLMARDIDRIGRIVSNFISHAE